MAEVEQGRKTDEETDAEEGRVKHLDFPPPPVRLARDYLEPDDAKRCPESFRLAHERFRPESNLSGRGASDPLIEIEPGRPRTILHFTGSLPGLASSRDPVLIVGEKGTGKGEEARAILRHESNPRREKPFGEVDCEEVPGSAPLLAAIFGQEADGESDGGMLARCDGGTVLIRNVDRMPAECAKRLLRFLRRAEFHPMDSDEARETVDVRVIATARETSSMPPELLGEFGEVIQSYPLRELKPSLPTLLCEFLRPHDRIAYVRLDCLLDLLCRDWPWNIGELRQYCAKAKPGADGRTLCSLPPSVARATERRPTSLRPEHVVNILLALAEKEIVRTPGWPVRPDVPETQANGLRLLAQLHECRRARGGRRWRGDSPGHPHYYHPYRIPLSVFFEGGRRPACYGASHILPGEGEALYDLCWFLLRVAELTAAPDRLVGSEEFRRHFGDDPGVVAAIKPSEGFLYFIEGLSSSVPDYETLRQPVPPLPQAHASTRRPRASRRGKPGKACRLKQVTRVWRRGFRIEPRDFSWNHLTISYVGNSVWFSCGGRTSPEFDLESLKGLGYCKGIQHKLIAPGYLLQRILLTRCCSFTLDDVIQCSSHNLSGNDGRGGRRNKRVTRAAAAQVVYRLNHALWDLVLDVKHPGDEKMNPIMPSRHSSQYDVRFSVLKKAGGAEDIESRRSERKAGEHVSRGRVRVNGKFRDLPHREEPDRGSAIENHISNNDEINRDDEAPDDGPAGC